MSNTVVAGLSLPDSAELRSAAGRLSSASVDMDHHSGRVGQAIASAPGEVDATAVKAALALASRWDVVGGALTKLAAAGDSASTLLSTYASAVDTAGGAWRAAVSSAAAQDCDLTAQGDVVVVTPPTLPSTATATDTSTQQNLVQQLQQSGQVAVNDLQDARGSVLTGLRNVNLPHLDDLASAPSSSPLTTGDVELDEAVAAIARPLLSSLTNFPTA